MCGSLYILLCMHMYRVLLHMTGALMQLSYVRTYVRKWTYVCTYVAMYTHVHIHILDMLKVKQYICAKLNLMNTSPWHDYGSGSGPYCTLRTFYILSQRP